MVEALGISLKDFIFYLINFLILVAVLGKFLYKPFVNALKDRKLTIKAALENAEMTNRKADEKMASYEKRIAKVESEGKEIIRAARLRAENQANAIIGEANEKADELLEQARQEIEREKEKALADVREQIGTLAIMAAERIMEKEIEVNGQDQIIDKVIEEAGAGKWQS